MSVQGLMSDKLGNFLTRYANEIAALDAVRKVEWDAKEHTEEFKEIAKWQLTDLVKAALLVQPYWGFVEDGHFEALLEMASMAEHPVAATAVKLYHGLTGGRRDQLHKYLAFFLHGIHELTSKDGGSP